VKVKFPWPLQALDPIKVHVPATVLLGPTPPCRVSCVLLLVVEVTVIPNVPVTLPLKLPLRVKVPVSEVSPDTKHEPVDVDVNVKFVTLSPPPLASLSVVVKE